MSEALKKSKELIKKVKNSSTYKTTAYCRGCNSYQEIILVKGALVKNATCSNPKCKRTGRMRVRI
jgi:hypothetical protein